MTIQRLTGAVAASFLVLGATAAPAAAHSNTGAAGFAARPQGIGHAANPKPGPGRTSVLLELADADPAGMSRLSQARQLTAAQRAAALAKVGPSAATRSTVLARLEALGLRVDALNRYSVTVSGPSTLVDSVFGKAPARTDGPHARKSTAAGAVVPSAVAGLVKFALSSDQPTLHMHPLLVRGASAAGSGAAPSSTLSPSFTAQPGEVTGARARALYGDPASTGVISTPAATIATIQFSGWNSGDLTTYASQQVPGLSDPLASGQYTAVNWSWDPTVADGYGGDVEVALDQESLLATAPNADQRAYFISNNGTTADYVGLLDQIATDAATVTPKLTALSISWGLCEQAYNSGDIAAMDSGFQTLAAAGVTAFAAAGDAGSYDCDHIPSPYSPVPAKTLAVDYPGTSPYVVSVGGLTTSTPETPSTPGETVWWDGSTWGGGGGQSVVEARPTWQPSGSVIAGTHRLVPDISLAADSSFGPFRILTSDNGAYGCTSSVTPVWCQVGGTSLASPLAAATLANIQLASDPATNEQLGSIGPLLYGAGASRGAYRDIASGTNGAFSAGPGYDEASGLGAPNWSGIWWSSAWQAAKPDSRFPAYANAGTLFNKILAAPVVTGISGAYVAGYQAGVGIPNTNPAVGTWSAVIPTTVTGLVEGPSSPWVSYRYVDGAVLTVSGSTVIDLSAPSGAPALSPAVPNGTSGWYRTNVTVTWNWTDTGSGISGTCPTSSTVATQGADVPVTGHCADRAGNVGTSTMHLKIDKTAPTVTESAALAPVSGTRALLRWSGSDATSGVANYLVSLTRTGSSTNLLPATPVTSISATPTLARGATYVLSVRAVDKAGNISTPRSVRFAVPLSVSSFAFTSGWGLTYAPGSIAGVRKYASNYGQAASIVFTAKQYQVLFTTCASCGNVAVYVDGRLSRVVSTYSASTKDLVAGYTVTFATAGRHAIGLRVLHTKASVSKGYAVILDGLLAVN